MRIAWAALALTAASAAVRPSSAFAQVDTAAITYPANGAVNVDVLQPIQWTAVPNAQAYYLYIGTAIGAKDLVNSGETQQTSYFVANLPPGQTLYVRLSTKVGGIWRFTDSTFTAAPVHTAAITYPAAGQLNADMTTPFQWSSVPNAQAYYLYVGTTAGAKNLVDTGELHQLWYLAPNLPAGQTLYARIYTELSGAWWYTDTTFTALPQLTAMITYPLNGAINADLTRPVQWSTVPNVQAYYLYLGTTPGATDLVNSGELSQTSYLAGDVPAGQTLYARMHTKVDGVWRFRDSTFTAAPSAALRSTITYPADGAVNADLALPMTWSAIANVQAYYLYVGTAPGAKDLVNSGETLQTSYQAANLPIGQTLYARISTKVGGVWRYRDSTFSVGTQSQLVATFTSPASGATNVNPLIPIAWTTIANAQAYYLYVGTSAGAKDLVNTGEMQQTSYLPAFLPPNQTLYAQIHTKVANVWRSSSMTFTAAPVLANVIDPIDGSTTVDRTRPIRWTAAPNAQAYYLYVGTSPGLNDIVDSYETQQTSFSIQQVPVNRTLYVRLYTKLAGQWYYHESTFVAEPLAAEFTYPGDRSTGVTAGRAFQWTPAVGGQVYRLQIGTTPGANDVTDSGLLTSLSFTPAGLPASGPLYARVWTGSNGALTRHTDIVFTLEAAAFPAVMNLPFDGQLNVDAGQPFSWQDLPLARAYRLRIGTSAGGSDLHDSGVIHVTRRFVPGLPSGVLLFGRLETLIAGAWQPIDFTFTVGNAVPSSQAQIQSARWATDRVRTMAFDDNRPSMSTELFGLVSPRYSAVCTDYAAMLLQMLVDMNVQLSRRVLNVTFNSTLLDSHTLVELLDPATSRWMLLDPTFDLTALDADGSFATFDDVSAATRAFAWTAITYQYLGVAGDASARAYYIDYPLLFLNRAGADPLDPPFPYLQSSPLPYLRPSTLPSNVGGPFFVIGCGSTSTAQVTIDGSVQTVACDGAAATSGAFYATSVAAPSGSSFTLYVLTRFVF